MSKRTTFTTISPLPAGISREAVLDFLHNHLEMIDLNPLIKERHVISPPAHAPPEEHSCVWYSLTDEISYLPGGLATGDVTYTCAFHDLPTGLQTHCYAPMGLEIRDKWTVAGSLPGEPIEPVELGIGAPLTGLYLREDVDMRCNVFTSSFVKKTLKKSHGQLVDRIKSKMQQASAQQPTVTGPPFSPFQLPSTSHARHHSQNSLSASYTSGSNAHSPPQPPLQTQHAPSYATLGNQMNLPYRPSCNKSLPATPDDENKSAYPQPLHVRHTSKGSIPAHEPSWPAIKSQPGARNNYVHTNYSDLNNKSYEVKSPPQSVSQAAYAPNGDANQRAGRQQSGPFMAELE
ncbi:hypothetical protein CkaCkLH20_00989 [Colletotrichum karsti]|uniref:DUF7053 domain-containing protein n=1 Tax=Colletotrichum karsti TaxID=1095194 RepID=A0A9P6IE35_9PEZI|nr:uncharacterized protein CkaCkLH20_00989 [Colletotrichum karsti]KAF9881843.1 hypothetical protein CkaCkLH20_00989 [Colletotrichum karsti]